MRTRLLVSALFAFATLAVLVSVAWAGSSFQRSAPVAVIAGSTYPWVQPVWSRGARGVISVTLPRVIPSAVTQPPAWIMASWK